MLINKKNPSQIIKFNVGGQFYQSSYDTVMRYNTLLRSLVEYKKIVSIKIFNLLLLCFIGQM